MIKRAKQVFDIEIAGLEKTRDSVGDAFVKAVEMILDCAARGGILVVSGVGKNLHIAEKMSAIFSSTGTRSIVLNPVQAMHGDLGMVSAKDILLALSFSGESSEVNNLIPAIRRHGLKVISMTGRPDSTLATLSDVHVEIPCGKEACPFGMAPTNSVTATLAMGDALAIALLEAKGFTREDFAMSHPGGALGRKLLLRNRDIMRTGDQLPSVSIHASVMDALFSITEKGLGMTAVTRDDGTLFGVFTDGDLRRLLDRNSREDLHTVTIGSVTREGGITMRENELVAKAVNIMQEKKINGLIVTDSENRPIGAFNMHDVLQAGAV